MNGIEIKTKRLLLKPLNTQYLDSVNEYAMDRENTQYMCHLPNEHVEETAAYLQRVEAEWKKDHPDFYEFAVFSHSGHIGAVSVYFDEGVGELGWIINRKYQGRGYACEAASAIIDYCMDQCGIDHFRAHCDTRNTASYRVMEKLGMVRTGEWGGRKNRSSSEESREYQYDLWLKPPR